MLHCVLYGNLHTLARSSFRSPFKLTKLKVLRGWKLLRHLPKKKHVRNLEGEWGEFKDQSILKELSSRLSVVLGCRAPAKKQISVRYGRGEVSEEMLPDVAEEMMLLKRLFRTDVTEEMLLKRHCRRDVAEEMSPMLCRIMCPCIFTTWECRLLF